MPVRLIGIPDGVRNFGGVLDHVLRELEIEVLPADIPEHVELDVTALTIGHSLFVRDLRCPRPRSSTTPTRRSARSWRRGPKRLRRRREEVATAEPELIRKPKAEAEGEAEEKA